jgi:cold shock CspA family protein
MTGRIKALGRGNGSGVIRAENGRSVPFDASALLAYDVACLAEGLLVTFDMEGGYGPRAVNICVHKEHVARRPALSGQHSACLRYLGFEQAQNVRAYRFERLLPGEETTTLLVSADMTLFARYHVALQEGPGLCLHLLLAAEPDPPPAQQVTSPQAGRTLTEQDMLAHVAAHPAPGNKARRKRAATASAA